MNFHCDPKYRQCCTLVDNSRCLRLTSAGDECRQVRLADAELVAEAVDRQFLRSDDPSHCFLTDTEEIGHLLDRVEVR